MRAADPTLDSFALQQAGIRASQLVTSFGFPRTEWDDLRQDLLLDYLRRREQYQSARGENRGFILFPAVERSLASEMAAK